VRGRRPLGSLSDQFSESGVELGSGRWVFLSVGSSEYGPLLLVDFDGPSVFVEKTVVVAA
jgi:hypothetical protein